MSGITGLADTMTILNTSMNPFGTHQSQLIYCCDGCRSWAFRKKTKKELKEEARAQQRTGSFEEDEDELFGEFDVRPGRHPSFPFVGRMFHSHFSYLP